MPIPSRQQLESKRKALKAGRAAYERKAWLDAWEKLTRADAIERLECPDLERLAWSSGLAGRHDAYFAAFERLYEAHLEAQAIQGAARAAFWLGFRLLFVGETGRGNAWVARAEELVERHCVDCPERGYVLLPKAYALLFRKQDASASRDLATAIVEIGQRFGDAELTSLARTIHGQALIALGEHDAGLEVLDQAMLPATSRQLGPMVTGIVYCAVIGCCQRVYAIDRSREWTAALEQWCAGQPQLGAFTGECRVHRAEILQLRGAWPEAVAEARLAAERFEHAAEPAAAALAFYQEAEILRLRGEFQAAESAYRRASELGCLPQPGLALLRLEQGQVDAAAAAIRQIVDSTTDPLARARYLPAAIEILNATGDREGAAGAARDLQRTAEGKGNPVLDAMAAHAAGSMGLADGDARRAIEPLRRAFGAWQSIGAPYLAARIRVLIASALEALGDRDGAQLERDAARKVFEELGAAPDLVKLPKPAAGLPPAHPFGLTVRELEVLRLLASGRTNRAIASELFLSEKTIDRHVSNLFIKLDVHTRAAATAFAYKHRLI